MLLVSLLKIKQYTIGKLVGDRTALQYESGTIKKNTAAFLKRFLILVLSLRPAIVIGRRHSSIMIVTIQCTYKASDAPVHVIFLVPHCYLKKYNKCYKTKVEISLQKLARYCGSCVSTLINSNPKTLFKSRL